ncbi:MAG: hypothetical protein WCZ01_01260 [Candidatus Neomarinimicrobiota bacterium]|jgi:integrase
MNLDAVPTVPLTLADDIPTAGFLENGTDLRYIKEVLGHASSKTKEIYTHVSKKSLGKIVNPLDQAILKQGVKKNAL